HADGRAHDPAPGVGHAEVVERALQRAVLAAWAVQRDPHALEALRQELRERLVARVEGMGIDAAPLECVQHRLAGQQRDLALAGVAAEQHRHAAEVARCGDAAQQLRVVAEAHQAGTPTMRTSGVSVMPCVRATVSRTCAISRSTSAARAAPWLMMKLACFCDTEASPMRKPLRPALSMRRAA